MDFAGTSVSPFSVQSSEFNPFNQFALEGLDQPQSFAPVGTTLGDWQTEIGLNSHSAIAPEAFDVNPLTGDWLGQVGIRDSSPATGLITTADAPTADLQVGFIQSSDPLLDHAAPAGQSVVFVDASVPDYQNLVAGLATSSDVIVIQPGEDGIATITETLAFYESVSAIHLVTHGDPGAIQLGRATLSTETLAQYANQLQSWQEVLTADADLLVYGCEVASGTEGASFVQQLSQLTGADVAASDDLTGNAALGGDWEFESITGSIETGLAFGESAIATYAHTLADIDFSSQEAAIRAGLVNLRDFAETLDTYLDTASDFAKALPIVDQDLGSAVDLSDLVETELIAAFDDYADATPTTGELAAFITSQTGWTVNDLSDADEIEFQVTLSDTTTLLNRAIELSRSAAGFGINLDGTGTLETQVDLTFTFGFDTAANEFFASFDSFNTEGNFTANLDGTGGRIGFVEFEVATNPGDELLLNAGLNTVINNGNRLRTANLQLADVSGLISSITPTGSLTATLPVEVTLNGFAPADIPEISLSYGSAADLFSSSFDSTTFEGAAPIVTLSNSLQDFTNITADDVLGMVKRVVDWFDRFRQSSLFDDIELPFVGDRTLSDMLDFASVLQAALIDPLETDPVMVGGVLVSDPTFTSVQDFADQLAALMPGVDINATYDSSDRTLTFDLDLSPDFDAINLPLNLDLDLSPLGNFTSGTTVQITPAGEFDFTFGIDLAPLGSGFTFDATTAISSLNNGTGILVNALGTNDLQITRRNGTSFEVDLSSLTTLGQVVTAIQSASGGTVSVTLDATQGRLVLEDNTTGDSEFAVTQINGSLAASGLGILTSDSVSNPGVIQGLSLVSRSLSERVFLTDASVNAGITLSTPGGINATAEFGFLGIAINDGSADINALVDVSLLNGNPADPTTLADLYQALTAGNVNSIINTPTVNASANLLLQNISVNDNFLGALSATPSIAVNFADLTDPGTLDVQFTNFDPLNSFQNLDFSNLIGIFRNTVDFLETLTTDAGGGALALLNEELPLIDRSINDLLDYADRFAAFVDDLESNPAQTIQAVEALLEEALGLTPDSPLVDLSIDGNALRIDLAFVSSLTAAFGMEMELAELAALAGISLPASITDLIGVSSAAELDVEVQALLNLALGIDLSDPLNPRPFIYDGAGGTGMALSVQAAGSNLDFTAQFGPMSLGIEDGTAFIGAAGNAPAVFAVSLDGSSSGRRYFDAGLAGLTGAVDVVLSDAIATATLPLQLPDPLDPFNLELSIDSLAALLDGSITSDQITLNLPNFTDLLALPDFGLIGLLRDPGTLVDGLDTLLGTVQDLLDGEIFGTTLPLVGDALAPAGQFIENFREAVLAEISNQIERAGGDVITAVQLALFNVFGAASAGASIGLGLLRDKDGNGIAGDLNDIEILGGEAGDDFVQFDMQLGTDLIDTSVPIDFDLGLPVLGFDLDAEVSTKLGWAFDLSFGVSESQGFYFDTSDADELEVFLDISLDNPGGGAAQATGNLDFLQIQATDQTGDDRSGFGGRFVIDLKDPGQGGQADDRFTFSELLAFPSLSSIFEADLRGLNGNALPTAQVNMDLALSFGGSARFPRMLSEFGLEWGFDVNNFRESSPTIAFRDIRLDAGSFLSDFAKPIFGEIKPILDVVGPVIDFLDARVPLISDLLGRNVTMLDIAETLQLLDASTIQTARQFIEAVQVIRSLVDLVASVPDDSSVVIPFGDFVVGEGFSSNLNLNLRGTSSSQLNSQFNSLSFSAIDPSSSLQSGGGANDAAVVSKTQSFISQINNAPNGGIKFPILTDPGSVIGLLFGQDADLFFYDMPEFDFTFPYEQEFRVLGVIKFTLGGSIGAAFDYDFGYDTFGLRKFFESDNFTDVFDGFFFGDLDSNGFDKPETVLRARIFAEGGVDIGIAGGGVGGGLTGTANFNLNDPNDDGKIRISEIAQFIEDGDYECIFDITGNVVLDFYAFVEAFFGAARKDFPIADFELLEFDFTCEPEPVLATDIGNGVLRLNTGRFASERIYGNIEDGNENFTVTQSGGTITVSGSVNGVDLGSQTFTGITKIIAEGGQGNDVLDLSSVQVVTELSGGIGQDTLRGGSNRDIIRGNEGDDDIYGNGGNDLLFGEQGQDDLFGGAGEDYLSGGEGNGDNLRGEQGEDTLEGGLGNDTLDGGDDNDTYLFASNWGTDTVLETPMGGTQDTWQFSEFTSILTGLRNDLKNTRLDFSTVNLGLLEVTTDLNIRLELGSMVVTTLSNRVQHSANNIERILGGRGDDIFEVFATGANLLTLDGQRGDDDYIVYAGPNLGDLQIRDTGPTYNRDRLIIEGTNDADIIGLTNTQITFGEPVTATLNYDSGSGDSGLEIMLFNLRAGDDTLNVASTPTTMSVTANGDEDNDTFNVGIGAVPTVNDIDGVDYRGPLVINGNDGFDILNVDDSGDTTDNTGTLTDNTITGLGMTVGIRYETLEDLTIRLGTGSDTFTVEGTHGGSTTVYGNDGEDTMTIESVAGATTINGDADDDTITVNAPDLPINPILVVNGQGGNDIIDASFATLALILNGDDDDDEILGGAGNDLIGGGAGNDEIDGNAGNDEIYGDSSFPAVATDPVYVGFDFSGDAMLNPPNTRPVATAQLPAGNDTIQGGAGDDTIYGEGGNDNIIGGSTIADAEDGRDYIYGGAGDDAIAGDNATIDPVTREITVLDATSGAADIILGDGGEIVVLDGGVETSLTARSDSGSGNDRMAGGIGDDILLGDNGKVTLNSLGQLLQVETIDSGVGGNDEITGNDDNDRILAGAGNDDVTGDTGEDLILGDEGQLIYTDVSGTPQLQQVTTLNPSVGGTDTLSGGSEADIILGGASDDDISGDAGDDILLGDNGQVVFTDGQISRIETTDPDIGGNDAIAGDSGADRILGGAADDNITGGSEDDIILGDNGQILFTDGQISRIETTDPDIGGNDAIAGDEGADRILGGAADDDITGGSEDDIILGDNGLLDYAEDGNLTTLDRITTTDPSIGGQDTIQGNAGQDVVLGGVDDDHTSGNEDDDILLGDNGQVVFTDGQISHIETTNPDIGGNDAIAGGNGDDIALGGAGDDQIQGNRDRDILLGDNGRLDYAADGDLTTLDQVASTDPTIGGNDVIEGNEADDIAIGGAGDDSIMGNQQNDILLGDNGQILLVDNQIDVIETTDPTSGGRDAISGNAGSDIILGGASDDVLHGDEDHDIILGDHGRLDYTFAGDSQVGADSDRTTLDIVQSTDPTQGGQDYIAGGDDQDDIFGGTDSDSIFGDGSLNLSDLNWSLMGAADFNQDGLEDTLWQNTATGQITIQIRRANGQHEAHSPNVQVLNRNWQVQGIGDIDGDGDTDIIWRNSSTGQTSAWLMDGLIWQSGGALSLSPDLDWQLDAIGDLNGDGKDELLWRNANNGATVAWFMNGLIRQSGGPLSTSPTLDWQLVTAGDLNGDGKDELLWRNANNGTTVAWFMNGLVQQSGGPLSASPTLDWQLTTAGDLNGDGKDELLWRNANNGAASAWFMNSLSRTATQPFNLGSTNSLNPVNQGWQLAGITTIDQTANVGLLWRNTFNGRSFAAALGSADIAGHSMINAVTAIQPTVSSSDWQLDATADFNGDGHVDQLWRNDQTGQISIWLMNYSSRVSGNLLPPVALNWQIQGAGDFDGDGNADILWRNLSTNQLSIWLMDGATRLDSSQLSVAPPSNWQVEAVADFDQDGKADILWRNRINGINRVWFMDGFDQIDSGDLSSAVRNLSWQVEASGDLNGDGSADLAWRNGQTGQTVIWYLDDSLTITDRSHLLPARADDLILGDHGALYKALPAEQNYLSIHTGVGDGGGNDLIYGNEGDDTILGQQGSDFLYGNSGEDDMLGGHNVQGGADAGDTMNGGSEADVMLGDNGQITRRPGINGTWQRYPAPFADVIRDVVRFDDAETVQGFTQFFGNDVMQGSTGDDIMHGQRGNDSMRGGAGDDEMYGELGNDTMNGDAGQDTMLGDVGIITRAYLANGRPRINADGSWHRDVILTDVGTVVGTANSGAQLPESSIAADILLLTGAANQGGVSNSTIQRIDLELANNDIVDGGDGNDQVFGQRGNDIVQGGNGQDYVEGNAGNDSVNGGAGDDFLIGDDGLNLAAFSTQQPILQRGFHLIDAATGVDLNLGTYGTVVLPHLQIAPQMIQGIFSPIALMPELTRDASPVPTIGNLRRLNGTELTVFASVIPSMTGHQDLLSGNDAIQGADGQDTIVGDNYTNAVPLRSTNGAFNQELDRLTRDVYQLGIGLQDLELGLDYRDRTSAHTFAFGQDAISGGSGLDSIVGDDSFAIGPFSTQSLSLQSSLGQTVTQLRQVITDFSRSVNRLRTSLSVNGSGYQPHTLRIGLDVINGDDGDDKITGDDQLLLAPIVDPLPYQRNTFWNYGFGDQLSNRIQPLRGYNLVVGNDTVNGGNGNDLIEGDYSIILAPIVNTAPRNANQRLVLEQSLDLLITDVNAFIRDLHQDTFGINFNQQNQANSLSAGNDTLRGDNGDDLVLGDAATFILPWVANQVDLSLVLQNGNLDTRDEAHNFRHLLSRAYDYLYRQAGVGSTTLGQDAIGGGNNNDILFGLSNIDAIFGQNGNDFLFGGKEADQLNGGSGQNVIRATNPARQDETAIAPVIDAHLAALLSPAMQSYLREIVQFQNTPALNGKLFGTILN
ncbi:MAG: DUF4347 domain-containing protein [Thainema sp.]